jgi:hypothetical protein
MERSPEKSLAGDLLSDLDEPMGEISGLISKTDPIWKDPPPSKSDPSTLPGKAPTPSRGA